MSLYLFDVAISRGFRFYGEILLADREQIADGRG